MASRVVVVGAVAGGASFAARARRLSENANIILLERSPDVSYANCGMPYYIGGVITDRDRLAVQTPASLKAMLNVDARPNTEALRIDRVNKVVHARNLVDGSQFELPYDKLVLAPGAMPRPLPSVVGGSNVAEDDACVCTMRTLADMDKIKARMDVKGPKHVTLLGGGFISLEMAEMLRQRNIQVTLVESNGQVLGVMDKDMVREIEAELHANAIDVQLNTTIARLDRLSDQTMRVTLDNNYSFNTNAVLVCVGVLPDSALAANAGLSLGVRGAIVVNEYMQTSDPDIYAVGDVVETADPVLGKRLNITLGGPANRQGRTAADHMFLGPKAQPYPGTLGTAIVRVFDLAAGVTGWSEKALQREAVPFRSTIVASTQHASYFPGATPICLKILWSPEDGRLLGAQATGADGVDKRLDVLATALHGRMTVEDLCHLELAYAPPFGSAKDVVNLAGFCASNEHIGLYHPTTVRDLKSDDVIVVDVRPPESYEIDPPPFSSVNIPLAELRDRLGDLDPSKRIVTVCNLGKLSYFASRLLEQNGFKSQSLGGGLSMMHTTMVSVHPPKSSSAHMPPLPLHQPPVDAIEIDACGIACPGPILKLKAATDTLTSGQELIIRATDCGFPRDVEAYCRAHSLEFLNVIKEKGIYTARIRKSKPVSRTGTAAAKENPAAGTVTRPGAALIVFSGDMDKVLAALIIANGAAALGGPVTMFFTFWGLTALRREGQATATTEGSRSLMDRLFGLMLPSSLDRLPLSQWNMMGVGASLMKHQMATKQLPQLQELMNSASSNGVRFVACSMSMEAMGIDRSQLAPEAEVGGVADFMEAASRVGTTLFI